MATIFMKIRLWVLIKELPSVMNKTVIVTMLLRKCSSITIQGLSRTKMNEKEFQGLSRPWKRTLKIQGFSRRVRTLILGPLFFILYKNDLPKVSRLTELLLFANDTSIFFLHSIPSYLKNVLNNELPNVDVWIKCNKFPVNIKKTNYVTFSPSQRKLNHSFSLSFGGQVLIQSNVTKFRGVYLDEHLTWKFHGPRIFRENLSQSIS